MGCDFIHREDGGKKGRKEKVSEEGKGERREEFEQSKRTTEKKRKAT